MEKDRRDLSEAGRAMGPLAEIARQVKEGKLTAKHLQALVEGKNPFEVSTPKYLVLWVSRFPELGNEFSADEYEWALPFKCDTLLPIGSTITLLDKERRSLYLEICEYVYEDDEILIIVKVSERMDMDSEIHDPADLAGYFRSNWVKGVPNARHLNYA